MSEALDRGKDGQEAMVKQEVMVSGWEVERGRQSSKWDRKNSLSRGEKCRRNWSYAMDGKVGR